MLLVTGCWCVWLNGSALDMLIRMYEFILNWRLGKILEKKSNKWHLLGLLNVFEMHWGKFLVNEFEDRNNFGALV